MAWSVFFSENLRPKLGTASLPVFTSYLLFISIKKYIYRIEWILLPQFFNIRYNTNTTKGKVELKLNETVLLQACEVKIEIIFKQN